MGPVSEAGRAAGGDDKRHQREPSESDHCEKDHVLDVGVIEHFH
jgi:hypothetical protein